MNVEDTNAPVRDGSELAKYETRRQQLARGFATAIVRNQMNFRETFVGDKPWRDAMAIEASALADSMLAHERAEEDARQQETDGAK